MQQTFIKLFDFENIFPGDLNMVYHLHLDTGVEITVSNILSKLNAQIGRELVWHKDVIRNLVVVKERDCHTLKFNMKIPIITIKIYSYHNPVYIFNDSMFTGYMLEYLKRKISNRVLLLFNGRQLPISNLKSIFDPKKINELTIMENATE